MPVDLSERVASATTRPPMPQESDSDGGDARRQTTSAPPSQRRPGPERIPARGNTGIRSNAPDRSALRTESRLSGGPENGLAAVPLRSSCEQTASLAETERK